MAFIKIINQYLLHPFKCLRKRTLVKLLDDCISGKAVDSVLEVLLELMSILFVIDKSFRRNIEGFTGKYRIQDQSGVVSVNFYFESNQMKLQETALENPDIDVTFKDPWTICEFLFSTNPDILNFVLHSKVSYTGNLNYLLKFAYMAKHIQLELLGK